MTCDKVYDFYSMLHSRITQHGGEDWFVDRAGNICSLAEVVKDKILEYSYFIRPHCSSSAGPVNPNHAKTAEDYTAEDE